ncbi:CD209 antigen-like [Palaemon carinicauda]|uniref:CD209 antigen-like n=1 Tax=Palaemon carinicauda TaxID=392227 RepID=UPI0035B60A0F
MSVTQWLKTGALKTKEPATPGLPSPADCTSNQNALLVQVANDAVDNINKQTQNSAPTDRNPTQLRRKETRSRWCNQIVSFPKLWLLVAELVCCWYLLLLLASSSCCSSQQYDHIQLSRIADSIEALTDSARGTIQNLTDSVRGTINALTDSVRAQEQTSEKLASALLKMFSFTTSEYLPCNEGWLKLGTSCYFLSVDTSTWHESRRKCIGLDSDLVKVTTDEEYNFLRDLVKGHDTWVGLTDLHEEGVHVWTDGTVHPMIRSWWSNGEPNSSEERCIHFFPLQDDRWNDKRCIRELRYICEKSVYPIDG